MATVAHRIDTRNDLRRHVYVRLPITSIVVVLVYVYSEAIVFTSTNSGGEGAYKSDPRYDVVESVSRKQNKLTRSGRFDLSTTGVESSHHALVRWVIPAVAYYQNASNPVSEKKIYRTRRKCFVMVKFGAHGG